MTAMIPMLEPIKNTGSCNSIIADEPYRRNFLPENLPDDILDQVWVAAARQGEIGLCNVIEEERFRRLEREVEEECYGSNKK